jgi:hypothetical protein
MHLPETSDGSIEFFLIANFLSLFIWVSEGSSIMDYLRISKQIPFLLDTLLTSSNQPVEPGCHNMLRFLGFEHIHTLVVDIACMINHVHPVTYTHLNRISSTSMCTKSSAETMSFLDACGRLLICEIAILSGTNFGNLLKIQLCSSYLALQPWLTSSPLILSLIWSTPRSI